MSEQHVPTNAEVGATLRDVALELRGRLDAAELASIEYAAQRLERALPDRETIAQTIDPKAWEDNQPQPGIFSYPPMQAQYEDHFWRAVQERRQPSLRAADAVLALFGQEGRS